MFGFLSSGANALPYPIWLLIFDLPLNTVETLHFIGTLSTTESNRPCIRNLPSRMTWQLSLGFFSGQAGQKVSIPVAVPRHVILICLITRTSILSPSYLMKINRVPSVLGMPDRDSSSNPSFLLQHPLMPTISRDH
jgi:hypothetical protein